MQDLNNMAIFAKVAEYQGISPAARALRMPKSKVSRRMVALEDALGVRLLERSTRAVRLTEIGEIYYRHCRRIVEEAQSARESVTQMLEVPRGHLRISASVAIGQHLLAPLIGEFMATYPAIDLELQLENRRVDLIREGYDAAIRLGKLSDSAYVSLLLGENHAVFVASPHYLKREGVPRQIEELQHHRFLVMGDAPSLGHRTVLGPEGEKKTMALGSVVRLNDLTVIRQVALDGGGVALLPRYLCGELAQETSGLRQILPDWHSPPIRFYALYPSKRSMTLKLRAWLDFLKSKWG